MKLSLKISVSEYPHTTAVRDGSIPIEGVDAEIVTVRPQIAAFRRMVRQLEFDVCELAPTTYIIAKAHRVPLTALPIFLMRRFHHGGLLVHPEAGVNSPRDLEGKKVGVRAYSVTTGVWTRGILSSEFGLDCSRVTWVVDDEEHVTQLQLPANVVHAAEGQSLAQMMANGELAAGFQGNAGIGRSGSPFSGWKAEEAHYPDLLPDAAALESEWFKRTGIYPIHGTIAVKDSALARHPWIAKSIFEAFSRAKNEWLKQLDANGSPENRKYSALRQIVGDPLPYGIASNLRTIKALEETAFQQGLTPRRIPVGELFADPEK